MPQGDINNRMPLKRVAVEGVVIVLSILLAFGIDAWWDARAQADRERRHLESLDAELERNDRLLEEAREYYEARYSEASWLLSALDGSVPVDEERVHTAVTGLFINRTFHLETGARQQGVPAGRVGVEVGSTALAGGLGGTAPESQPVRRHLREPHWTGKPWER